MKITINPVGGWRRPPTYRPPMVSGHEFREEKNISAEKFRNLMSNHPGPKPQLKETSWSKRYYDRAAIEAWWRALPVQLREV